MNVSIESLLADAKYLVGRLKDHDVAAEALAEQTSSLQKDIEARNTYQENLKELNKVAGHRPRSTLVLGIQQENCAIRSLQNENDELRQSLTDHQNALELIMTKYRHQMVQFMNNKNLLQVFPSKSTFSEDEKQDLVKTQMLMDKVPVKIYEMAAVMQKAIHIDDQAYHSHQEYISSLEAENSGLRDLLLITNGALGSHFTANTCTDSDAAMESNQSVSTVVENCDPMSDSCTNAPESEDPLT
uniref:FGFR1 oncogene partner 2 homolog n=1 Tax=Phallusia mammillata TaxID=59560 RepID=A0A6F9DCS9_9ASCI|nr:FGFR1 oncogene partner 2 homolog [Phallusia mammillata]